MEGVSYQYRPDVFIAVSEAVPLICRSRQDVIMFFRGAGLRHARLEELSAEIRASREAGKKHETTRELLRLANENASDVGLRVRREIIKRITDFNNFGACWPADQLKAQGAVAKVRELVNEKDSFARMAQAQERERAQRLAEKEHALNEVRRKAEERSRVKSEFYATYGIKDDPRRRGLAFEKVLNKIFALDGISVREAFTLRGDEGEGVVEQIDGVVELDNHLYLVEAKWWASNLGRGDVTQHMMRVAQRGEVRGLYIVEPGYSSATIDLVRDELQRKVFVLAVIRELFYLFETDGSIADWLREKVRRAQLDRNPHHLELHQP